MTNSVDEVIDFISGVELADPECIHRPLRCLLDGLGALLAGRRMPVEKITARFALEHMPATAKESCTVFAG